MTKSTAEFDIVLQSCEEEKPAITGFEGDMETLQEKKGGRCSRKGSSQHTSPCRVSGGSVFSEPAALSRALAASHEAERNEAHGLLMELLDATASLEALTEDLFLIIAEVAPDRVAELRDQTAASFQRSVDGVPEPDGMGWPGFWRKRWQLLESVMATMGSPYQAAQIVSLAEVRRASKPSAADGTKAPR